MKFCLIFSIADTFSNFAVRSEYGNIPLDEGEPTAYSV